MTSYIDASHKNLSFLLSLCDFKNSLSQHDLRFVQHFNNLKTENLKEARLCATHSFLKIWSHMLDVMKLQYKTANLLQFGMLVIGRIFFLFETVEIQPQNIEKVYCYHCFSERSFRQKHITYKSHEQYVSSPSAFPCSLTFLEQKQEHSPEGAIKLWIIIITIVQPTLLLGLTSPQSFNRSEDNELKENCITVRKKIVIFLQNVYWYLIFFSEMLGKIE